MKTEICTDSEFFCVRERERDSLRLWVVLCILKKFGLKIKQPTRPELRVRERARDKQELAARS